MMRIVYNTETGTHNLGYLLVSKRYFYTDPLAAAWMAKHFGMRFDFWKWNNLSFQFLPTTNREARSDRLFIRPDSLHLLEPKVGDVLSEVGSTLRFVWDGVSKRGKPISEYAQFPIASCTIIQRDGKPFFWPESEAA